MGKRLLAGAIATLLGAGATAAQAAGGLSVHVLSNRADLISRGDALVAIDLPSGGWTSATFSSWRTPGG